MKHLIGVLLVVLGLGRADVRGQSSAFTYQGNLLENGSPASGAYDLRFLIYPRAEGGFPVAAPLTNSATAVTDGAFTVTLDFGTNVFTGADRWLEVAVKSSGSAADFTVLSPRQAITSTPYAIKALESHAAAAAASVTGSISAGQLVGTLPSDAIAAGSITAPMLAPGSVTSASVADGAISLKDLQTSLQGALMLTITNSDRLGAMEFGKKVSAFRTNLIAVRYRNFAQLYRPDGVLITTITNQMHNGGLAAVDYSAVVMGGFGSARRYSTNGQFSVTYTNPEPQDLSFGSVVAAGAANRVIVGAPNAGNGGAAYVFGSAGQRWNTWTNPQPQMGQQFGAAIAAVGLNLVAVGAPGGNLGAAYLFGYDARRPVVLTNIARIPQFGRAIAAFGSDRVLVGAAGQAHLFSVSGQLLRTFASPSPVNSFFGSSLAVAGDRILIGSPQRSLTQPSVIYIYNPEGRLLGQVESPLPASPFRYPDSFGTALTSFGADQFLVGTPGNAPIYPPHLGVVHVYRFRDYFPGLASDGVANGSIVSSSLANGAVTLEKLGSDIAGWQTFNGNAFRTNGNVAIGATNAAANLHVQARGSADIAVQSEQGRRWLLRSASGGAFEIIDDGPQTRRSTLAIRPSGNVGIGTTNPLATLHVNGTVAWGNSRLIPDQGGAIELGAGLATGNYVVGAKPYIDFHYNTGAAQDFNVRLVNDTNAQLRLVGSLVVTGVIAPSSDRDAKRDFAPVDAASVLEKVARLPIQSWAYHEAPDTRHIGPAAQDFHAAFGLGGDDRRIATVDADGVALAAIQGLHGKLAEREREIRELRQRLERLEKLLESPAPGTGGAQ